MSYVHNVAWSPSEKVDLLVNILQGAFPDLPAFLLQVIHDHNVYPRWNDICLPQGRSLHASQIAFEELARLHRHQGRVLPQPAAPSYSAVSNVAPTTIVPPVRQYQESDPYGHQQRTLQPRPPRSTDSPTPIVSNGEQVPILRPLASEPLQEVRKKRGRPSKEEAEERDRLLAAQGKVYQPKKRATKRLRPSTGTPDPERRSSEVAITPIRTPTNPHKETKEESSSQKRRAKMQQGEEALRRGNTTEEVRSKSTEPHDEPPAVAQSPSDRLLATHRERELGPAPVRALSPAAAENNTESGT